MSLNAMALIKVTLLDEGYITVNTKDEETSHQGHINTQGKKHNQSYKVPSSNFTSLFLSLSVHRPFHNSCVLFPLSSSVLPHHCPNRQPFHPTLIQTHHMHHRIPIHHPPQHLIARSHRLHILFPNRAWSVP